MALSFSIRAVDDPLGQGSVVLAMIVLTRVTGKPPEGASGLRLCSANPQNHLHAKLFTPIIKDNSICVCMIHGGKIPHVRLRKRRRRDQD